MHMTKKNLYRKWSVIVLFVFVVVLLIIKPSTCYWQSERCNSKETCSECLTEADELCSWCSQTSTCISISGQCQNATMHNVGRLGVKARKANKLLRKLGVESKEESEFTDQLLSQCTTRVETLEECIIGSEYAKIHFPFSTSVRNLQPGGLQVQPIIPVPQEFLQNYVLSTRNLSTNISDIDLEHYLREISSSPRNRIMLGAYFLNQKEKIARPHIIFSNLDYFALRGNYSIVNNTIRMEKSPRGKVLMHLIPGNIGIKAEPGVYHLGLLLAIYNELHDTPICMFYQMDNPVTVTSVYRAILVGIYLYVGLPLFVVGLSLAIMFVCCCKFHDTQKISEVKYDDTRKNTEHQAPNEPSNVDESRTVRDLRNIFSLSYILRINSDQIIAQCGLRGYYYWKFYRRLVLIVLLYAILALGIILPINIVFNYKSHKVKDFAITTFGSIGRWSVVSIPHYIVGVLFFLIVVVVYGFSIKLLYYKRRYEASIFTARLLHLPGLPIVVKTDEHGKCYIENREEIEERERLIRMHFDQILKSQDPVENEVEAELSVLSVSIVADMAHIISDVDAQFRLESLLGPDPLQKTHNNLIRKTRKKRLKIIRRKMIEKLEKKNIVSNQAFITFRSATALRKCKAIYKNEHNRTRSNTQFSDKISPFGVHEWRIKQSSWEPEDIKWENIYERAFTNIIRVATVYGIYTPLFLTLMVGLLLYFLQYGLYGLNTRLHVRQVTLILNSSKLLKNVIPLALGFTSSVFSVFLTVSGEVANILMSLASTREMMKSYSKESASYLLKSVSIIIPFYLTIPFLGDYLVELRDPESFYSNTGLALMQFILSYLFLYKGLELIGACTKLFVSYYQNGREVRRIPFDFNQAYTSSLVIFFIIAVTGIRFPLLFIPGVAFFVMTYLIDTFMLLFFYEKPEGTGRIEFGTVSSLLLVFAAAAMFSHPSLSALLAFGSLIFVIASLCVLIFIIYLYQRRGKKKSTCVQVEDEEKYREKYSQPHLRMLFKCATTPIERKANPLEYNV